MREFGTHALIAANTCFAQSLVRQDESEALHNLSALAEAIAEYKHAADVNAKYGGAKSDLPQSFLAAARQMAEDLEFHGVLSSYMQHDFMRLAEAAEQHQQLETADTSRDSLRSRRARAQNYDDPILKTRPRRETPYTFYDPLPEDEPALAELALTAK